MIDWDSVGICLDNIQHLGCNLLAMHDPACIVPWLFKSDISQAYWHLSMHPFWQVKQVITLKGQQWVNHCNNFGD